MSKHTPGPWKYIHDDDRTSMVVSGDGRVVIHTHMEPDNPEAVADARLIAAAPLMLEALENLENDSGDVMPDSAWELVQQAVEAATGRRKT